MWGEQAGQGRGARNVGVSAASTCVYCTSGLSGWGGGRGGRRPCLLSWLSTDRPKSAPSAAKRQYSCSHVVLVFFSFWSACCRVLLTRCITMYIICVLYYTMYYNKVIN